jgi:hypothetical protein
MFLFTLSECRYGQEEESSQEVREEGSPRRREEESFPQEEHDVRHSSMRTQMMNSAIFPGYASSRRGIWMAALALAAGFAPQSLA